MPDRLEDNVLRSQLQATQSEVAAENGLVVGGHALQAEAGLRVLQEGGNAVDAAVAAAFAGFVCEPSNCGVGGYARLAIFWAERREFFTVDAYVRAPGAARPDMFELDLTAPPQYYGHPHTVGRRAERGFLAPAVPGAVAGLCAAHAQFGALPLAQVLEPAIEIAAAGLPVDWRLALTIGECLGDLAELPDSAAILAPGGRPPSYASPWSTGERLDFSALAGTLRRIAQHGAAGFYSGPVAEAIGRYVAAHGGILSAADLAAYRPKLLREQPARYRGYDYITAFDPVSYEVLNILECFDLPAYGPDSVEYRHLMAEACGHAFADNMQHYGDPDFVRSPAAGLSSRAFGAARAAGLRLDRAAPRPLRAADPWPYDDPAGAPEKLPEQPSLGGVHGTTQMAAADRAGNLVTICTSLTSAFGSKVYVPEAGVFLNNGMQNFDPRPEQPNGIQPGKMPIFGVPVLAVAKDGQAVFGDCGSGGYRILSGTLHAAVNALDFGMSAQAAVDAPRVYCQGEETFVDARLPAEVQARLTELGHQVVPQLDNPGATHFGRVAAIQIDPRTRQLRAGCGPAWVTAAAGY
ncbi:MAG: gamma-glutamyltransferase [Anaerolineales bacterium]|nr:gamma-glutamyltransferase [Anaerolineales bacterium]